MGHLQTLETELRRLLDECEDEEQLVRFVKEQVLASYRNGQAAGRPQRSDAPEETTPAAAGGETPAPRRAWRKRSA